jgi:hypothetical protein
MRVRERSVIIIITALNRYIGDAIMIGITVPSNISVEVILDMYSAGFLDWVEVAYIDGRICIELVSDNRVQRICNHLTIYSNIPGIEYIFSNKTPLGIIKVNSLTRSSNSAKSMKIIIANATINTCIQRAIDTDANHIFSVTTAEVTVMNKELIAVIEQYGSALSRTIGIDLNEAIMDFVTGAS